MQEVHPEVLARFGRNPKEIFERDGWVCLICHSSKDLTIDHIDGNGRHSKNPNNELSNLRTLCRKCHGSIDGKRGQAKRYFGYRLDLPRIRKCIVCSKQFRIYPSKASRSIYCSRLCYLKFIRRGVRIYGSNNK